MKNESKPDLRAFPSTDCPKCKGTGRVPHTTTTPGEYEHCNCYHYRPVPADTALTEKDLANMVEYFANRRITALDELYSPGYALFFSSLEGRYAVIKLFYNGLNSARDEEKQAVLNFISAHGLRSGAVEMIAEGIEQNKHRKTP